MLSKQIKSKIDSLWDKFWSGGIANPLTAIEQISYLLFMKRLDEMDLKKISDAKFLNYEYTSIFSGVDENGDPNENKRWSYFKHLEPGEMLKYVQTSVFPFIKTLNKDSQQFSKHMRDAVFIIPKASLLAEAVSIIDQIYELIEGETDSKHTFTDVQGDIYEELLSQLASSGKNGQFRTPRHIINMMCELVDPKLGEKICDPACGTAGFLLGAYHHILKQHTSESLLEEDENGIVRGLVGDKLTDDRQWEVLKNRTFYGYDFDTTMVRIALMNLMLHGIDNPNIEYMDALSKKYEESDYYDLILANPPFTGSIDKGDINADLKLNTVKTELLFVNKIYNLLRQGGRAAVVVPQSVLFGDTKAHKDLRKILLNDCELRAVITLPVGVFLPYADASTAILVLVKGGKTETVWFSSVENDGYTLDDRRQKVSGSDIPELLVSWKKQTKGSGFYVERKTIEERDDFLIPGMYRNNDVAEEKFMPNGWHYVALENIVEEVKETPKEGEHYNVLSITKYDGFVESEIYFNKRVYSKDTSKYKVVCKTQFAYSPIHLDEGSLGYLDTYETGIISPMYKVFKIKQNSEYYVNPLYLYHLLKSEKYLEIYKNLGKGSVKRRKAISFDTFKGLRVLLPTKEVQDSISDLSQQVALLNVKLNNTKRDLEAEVSKVFQNIE